ncbi:MAG: DUF5688 family protein [Eubacterium sp.]|nr:DUF5688 family protein [Eubacterium sp.]
MSDNIYNTLCEKVRESLKDEYDIRDIRVHVTEKNNGVSQKGIVIRAEGCQLMPCIYPDNDFIQNYENYTEEEIDRYAAIFADNFRKCLKNNVEGQTFIDFTFETVKDKVILSLVNLERNRERLESCPYIIFNDLAITFRVYYDINVDSGSVLIDNRIIDYWGVSVEELWNHAIENMTREYPAVIERLDSFISNICNLSYDQDDNEIFAEDMLFDDNCPLYMLTNNKMFYGATAMLYKDVLSDVYNRLGTDYYILPSSINELIVVSKEECDDTEYLKSMVKEINIGVVSEIDYLSDSIYFYDHEQGRVSVVA